MFKDRNIEGKGQGSVFRTGRVKERRKGVCSEQVSEGEEGKGCV